MIEIKDTCYKGTRILLGNEKQEYLYKCIEFLKSIDFIEIQIPIIQLQKTFKNKVGQENNNMMYNFNDKKNRELCLAPEYTAVIQQLSKTIFKQKRDLKVFYIAECFRGENPQAGRYRQFTQLGVEIINPSKDYNRELKDIAIKLYDGVPGVFEFNSNVKRGLDYYKEGKGFEIIAPSLGAQKQICGGGEYDGGIGFAFGVDRILQLLK